MNKSLAPKPWTPDDDAIRDANQTSDSAKENMRVDCGDCPNITFGCRAGHCLRKSHRGDFENDKV